MYRGEAFNSIGAYTSAGDSFTVARAVIGTPYNLNPELWNLNSEP